MIEIGVPIKKGDFKFEKCFPDVAWTYYLPTQFVVSEAKIVVPDTARVYRTGAYLYDGEVRMSCEELREAAGDDFNGTSGTEGVSGIYALELFCDDGMDGNVKYIHVGYVYLTGDQISPDGGYPESLVDDLCYKLNNDLPVYTKCSFCDKMFQPGDESIENLHITQGVVCLCRDCYKKAGNSVR